MINTGIPKLAFYGATFTLAIVGLLCSAFMWTPGKSGLEKAFGQERVASTKPNVLFIAVDDLNDWIGVLGGYPGVQTPNLDKLAKKGLLFTRAYCTAPECGPSRASLLTGIRPSTSGVYNNYQPWRPVLPKAVTLPQYFTANGYEVMGSGKVFHNSHNDLASWPVYHDVHPSPVPPNKPVHGKGHFDWSPVQVKDEEMGDYKDVQFGIDFLQETHQKSFFLAVGITRPHLPWYVPQQYFDKYPLSKIVLPNVKEDDLADVPPVGRKIARPEGDHKFVVDNKQWEKAVQGYLASITFADAQIGRLLDALEKSTFTKNTIIVLWGDHGWHLGEKKHWRKFALWEEATRVPLMMVVPGITKANSVCERTVNLIDLYPTLLDLCNLPTKKGLEGNSIARLVKNPRQIWNRPSVTTYGQGNHAVRSERWRYIHYHDGSEELYDHQNDPMEWNNRAGDPALKAIKKELAQWLPKVNAPDAPADQKNMNDPNG